MYSVDILSAMRWTTTKWEECPSDTIMNSFLYCIKQGDEIILDGAVTGAIVEVREQMERNATESGVDFTKIGMDKLLNPGDEDNIIEDVTFEKLG